MQHDVYDIILRKFFFPQKRIEQGTGLNSK